MFDNFGDYTLAELKQLVRNYRNHHNIKITKKTKQDLVNLLNEKFVLRNRILYLKLPDDDRTENILNQQNYTEDYIPQRIRRLPSQAKPVKAPKRRKWNSQEQMKEQSERNKKQNVITKEAPLPPKVYKRLKFGNSNS